MSGRVPRQANERLPLRGPPFNVRVREAPPEAARAPARRVLSRVMSDNPGVPPHTVQLQIDLDPVTANGVFINMAMVNHTETEFTLDLVYIQPQAPKATVRARVITTPKHMKRLLHAIEENVAKYEARFGALDLGDAPHFPPPGGAVA